MKENVNPFLAIKANYIQMNPAMKRIADVLLESPPKRGGYTIGMLAEKSRVSNATVTRFVRTLGFENYKTFLRAIQESFEDEQNGEKGAFVGPDGIICWRISEQPGCGKRMPVCDWK